MHHMFRQHGRAEFDVDLSGSVISEESLLQEIDISTCASCASATEISNSGLDCASSAGNTSDYSSQEGAEPTGTSSITQSLDHQPADAQSDADPQHHRSSEAHASASISATDMELHEEADSEQMTMEPIEWQPVNSLVRPPTCVSGCVTNHLTATLTL